MMPMGVSPTNCLAMGSAMSSSLRPPLRTWPDRVRQVVLFEGIGLLLITPLFAWAAGQEMGTSLGLMALMAALAALWNGLYATLFDYLERHLTGRPADRRPTRLRILHALGFEGGLLLLTLPLIVALTGLGWWAALLADLGLALTYSAYAFVFNLLYDRVFPLGPRP